MKNISLVLIILLGLVAGYSLPNYVASVNALDPVLKGGDALTLYGFIDYEVGQGNPYEVSALKLRYFKVGSNPSGAQALTGVNYLSDYSNAANLLVDGAYYLTAILPNLSNGRYTVQLLLNDLAVSQTFFDYDSTLSRDSKLSITSLSEYAGSVYAEYKVENNNATNNITYTVDFFIPTMAGTGSATVTDSIFVQNMTYNATAVSFTSNFKEGANIFVARVTSTDQAVPKLPVSVLRLLSSGTLGTISVFGNLTINPACDAKENSQTYCEFSVSNNGTYPASYTVEVVSTINNSVSFSSSLVNPGQTIYGNITLSAKAQDLGQKTLTLNLKNSGLVIDSKQVTIYVSDRDKINKLDLKIIGLNRNLIQGDGLSVTYKLNNTGDFDESVRIVYIVNEGAEYYSGGSFTLKKGQTITRTIDLTNNIRGLTGTVNFEIKAVNDDTETLASIYSGVNVASQTHEPAASWNYEVVRMEKGNVSANYLTVQNNGNVEDMFRVIVNSNFAVHTQIVTLSPGDYATLAIPVVSGSSAKGIYSVGANVCSEISDACDSANFSVIIYELPVFGNAVVKATNTSATLESGQAGIFEIAVKNNNAETREYKVVIGGFNGEVKVSPESKYVLSGLEEKFWIYLMPAEEKTQSVEYKVLESNVVIKTENLTLSYDSSMLTGFLTIGTASNVAVSILGLALLSGLIVLGVRAFNQSKMELKYWK